MGLAKLSMVGLSFLWFLAPAWAGAETDWSKVVKAPAKEPAYQSKSPRYCLLAFGHPVEHTVWLVHDGDRLFVDRNGNGDLTEAGELVLAAATSFPEHGIFYFEAGELRLGPRTHQGLWVGTSHPDRFAASHPPLTAAIKEDPNLRGYQVMVHYQHPRWKGIKYGGRVPYLASGLDQQGLLTWSTQWATAPVLHVDGPLQLFRMDRERLVAGKTVEFIVNVGTPGRGAGATMMMGSEDVMPPDAHPVIELKSTAEAGAIFHERYELKQRC